MSIAAKRLNSFLFAFGFWLVMIPDLKAQPAVFTDRASFNAAATNLRLIDFDEPLTADRNRQIVIDGVIFDNTFGALFTSLTDHFSGRSLFATGAGEITQLTIFLPPGTTAVGCDQFTTPMDVFTSTGQSFTIREPRESTFIGFVSDTPIRSIVFSGNDNRFPDFNPNALEVDNLVFGQRSQPGQATVPLLLTDEATGHAIALDSVTLTGAPFSTFSAQNFSADRRTRISLFAVGVALAPGESASAVTARAEDAQHNVYDLATEFVGRSRSFSWLTQVVVRLPEELRSAGGQVDVSIQVHGASSNKAVLRLAP